MGGGSAVAGIFLVAGARGPLGLALGFGASAASGPPGGALRIFRIFRTFRTLGIFRTFRILALRGAAARAGPAAGGPRVPVPQEELVQLHGAVPARVEQLYHAARVGRGHVLDADGAEPLEQQVRGEAAGVAREAAEALLHGGAAGALRPGERGVQHAERAAGLRGALGVDEGLEVPERDGVALGAKGGPEQRAALGLVGREVLEDAHPAEAALEGREAHAAAGAADHGEDLPGSDALLAEPPEEPAEPAFKVRLRAVLPPHGGEELPDADGAVAVAVERLEELRRLLLGLQEAEPPERGRELRRAHGAVAVGVEGREDAGERRAPLGRALDHARDAGGERRPRRPRAAAGGVWFQSPGAGRLQQL